ncbi:phosphatase PAP2 family protein [Agrococcus sp. Marseille-Q4369]|uniref:phosphatase PAP2 family protein n=1 Tax=Agrococcus sp. Marseille-Q4369 TaxID=2810513 RepID=UPI001B8B6B65|nr:phosphatase PAP2 family protein [Agrococcus sp. Marseille-Q4369]QUW19098.1 phosphatase PAP2 family protein [Agrococcus sp. Marseille-Q4369]
MRVQGTPDEHGTTGERVHDAGEPEVELARSSSPLARWISGLTAKLGELVGPYGTLILTLAIGAVVAFALALGAVGVYDAVTDEDGVAGIDRPLLDAILTIRDPRADAFITGFTDLAGTIGMPLIAILSLLILSLRRRSWTPLVLVVAAGAGSLLMTVAGKVLIGRDRPPLTDAVPPYEVSASFPSGHTLNAVAILGIIAYLLVLRRRSVWARAGIIAIAVVASLLVAASRVYLGHHWVTDVVAGWLLGAAWLAIVITAHRLYLLTRLGHDRQREPAPAS